MRIGLWYSVLFAAMALTGCAKVRDANRDLFVGLVAAEPLSQEFTVSTLTPEAGSTGSAASSPKTATWTLTSIPTHQEYAYLSLVLFDSVGKCKKLIDSQGILSRAIDVEFDSISTVLTALATAFTPLATVHALTAAAAIASGTKTNLDTDLYHQKTSDIIATQIDSTYFSGLNSYVDGLAKQIAAHPPNTSDLAISPQIEFVRIALIHRQCSIDLALGALAAKAKTPDPTTAAKAFDASDLKPGAPVPGNALPGWTVTGKTATTVTIKNTAKGTSETLPLETFLVLLNTKPGAASQ